MIRNSLSVNIAIRVIENICDKFDIKMKESHKSILAILIPAIIYRDGSIIILSETIHQIDRILKKKNDKINFVNILLAMNCISTIDKYGTVTIPLCLFLDKLKVNRKIITKTPGPNRYLSKKVLTNATQTICTAEMLSHLGIPKVISIPVINIILELFYTDIDKEKKAMQDANVAFRGYKMSEITKILKDMQFEKIFLSTALLLVITNIGLNISASLILVSIGTEIYEVLKAEYKMKTAKGFLK